MSAQSNLLGTLISNIINPRIEPKEGLPSYTCAFDFGTCYSGFCYVFNTDSSKTLYFEQHWPEHPIAYAKTKTSILYDLTGKPDSFGHVAFNKYVQQENSGPAMYFYLENFKPLVSIGDINYEICDSLTNIKIPLVEAISHFLKFLKFHLESHIKNGAVSLSKQVHWVMTVPAHWNEPQFAIMKKAALFAGMIEDENCGEDKLMFVREPEGAAICAMKYYMIKQNIKAFPEGTTCLTIDAGGGTLDMTVHKIDKQGQLIEMTVRHGEDGLGSNALNNIFEELLIRELGSAFISNIKIECRKEYFNLIQNFELEKRVINSYESTHNIQVIGGVIKDKFQKHEKLGKGFIEYKNRTIIITLKPEHIRFIFENLITKICNVIQLQFNQLACNVDYIWLAGGLCQNNLITSTIKTQFASKASHIISHQECGHFIQNGAALIGNDPTLIRCRMSSYFYGIAIDKEGDIEDYPQQYHCNYGVLPGARFGWRNSFKCFVKKGQSVGIEDKVAYNFHFPKNQKCVEIPIFSCPAPVFFVNEPHVEKVVKLVLTAAESAEDRIAVVEFNFKGVTIGVEVSMCGCTTISATLDFHSTKYKKGSKPAAAAIVSQ